MKEKLNRFQYNKRNLQFASKTKYAQLKITKIAHGGKLSFLLLNQPAIEILFSNIDDLYTFLDMLVALYIKYDIPMYELVITSKIITAYKVFFAFATIMENLFFMHVEEKEVRPNEATD